MTSNANQKNRKDGTNTSFPSLQRRHGVSVLAMAMGFMAACSSYDQAEETERAELAVGNGLGVVGNNGSPANAFPLGRCQGDCDHDGDCRSGLKCFQRDAGGASVPGCSGNPEGKNDYCYDPADAKDDLQIVGDNGSPASAFPLGKCEGDCDRDSDCEAGLKCFQRSSGGVPGCTGTPKGAKDYCYAPSEPEPPADVLRMVGDNGSPASAFPLGNCEGDCDRDSDCEAGLKCFQRSSGPVPGCTGTPEGAKDYCYVPESNQDSPLAFPIRGAFYYPWYPQTWTVDGEHVFYHPDLGYYTSDDTSVIDEHIKMMEYAKIDMAIASWWGPDSATDKRIPLLLERTVQAGSGLKWAMYYEDEGFGNPSVAKLQSDLAYIRDNYTSHESFAKIDGKPVVFVYNADEGSCEVANRWAKAAGSDWQVVLKVFGGYRNCSAQPSFWHQYGCPENGDRQSGYSYLICPGFWRADQSSPRHAREPERWYQNVREMVASSEPFQLVVSFNEWGEGTATEPAAEWTSGSGFGTYLDALHTDGQMP